MAPRLNFLPDALSRTLLEFQQEGVLFGISKNGRCLIGDEMGLGKTLQALSIAYYYKNEWPLLIVCPSSMRFPWIEEIEKWLPDIEPHELNLVQSGIDASNIKTSKISIVGYGLLSHSGSRLLINCLKEMRFGVVIVDESHYMKNRKAARTKALVSVIKKAKRAVLLTGTPALARPEELYVQIDVLKPNLLGSFSRFANRYCDAHTEHVCGGRIRQWNTQGASNLEELHNVLKTNVMIRRLKRHVLTQLPPKRRQRITFDLAESEAKKQMTEVIGEFRNACKQIKGSNSSQSQSEMDTNPLFEMKRLATVLYRQTGLSKITAVRQYIADMLDNSDKKFLVFAHHIDVMQAIEQEVVKKRVKYIRIAGDVRSVIRGSLVQQFQTDSSTRVAILSILAASMGITLTAADHIIFSELHWTPGVMEQAEDRVHRIGQENSVLVQYLVAKGTIDEVLWRMLCTKIYVTSTTLNGKLESYYAEEGSETQSKLLEAFSAWVMEDEEDGIAQDDFLFTHTQKKRKQDSLQRSLTEFFCSPSSTKCRKTDSGIEWSDTQELSTQKEPNCETVEIDVQTRPEPETCIVVDSESDEDSSIRKTTKKTYKLGKKKSVEITGEAVAVQASESQEMAWEFAREIIKVDADESSKPASAEVVDMLSSYTRLLNKSNGRNLEDACKENNVDGVDEHVAKSETGNSSNLVENGNELGKLVANDKASGFLSESSEKTVESFVVKQNNIVIMASECTSNSDSCFSGSPIESATVSTVGNEQTIDNVSSEVKETEPLTPNLALDKQNDCSQTSPIAARSDLAINSGNCEVKQNKTVIAASALDKYDSACDMKEIATRSGTMVDSVESQATQTKPVPLVPTSAEDINDFKTWCCSLCTFNNNAFLRVCEMCDTPRYKSRRKSMNTKCSTEEFVARKQLEILNQCSGIDRRKSGRKNDSKAKKSNKGLVVVSGGNEKPDSKRTTDTTGLSVNSNEPFIDLSLSENDLNKSTIAEHLSESKPEMPVNLEILVKPETVVEPEIPVNPEILVKPVISVKPEILVKPVNTFEPNTSDVDLFASDEIMTSSREDELMTSSCEDEIMTSPCKPGAETENLFGTESEFDDITDDDWWVCTSCKNYNYDDAVDQCEACGFKKPSDHFEDLVTGLENDDDCWRCEKCGEFNFGDDVIRECTKCCQGDKKKRKSLVEQYKKLRHLIVDDEELEGTVGTPQERTEEHVGKLEVIENMMFRLSNYTDRVYLYDGDGDPLNCNVNILDVEDSDTGSVSTLITEPSNRKQILRFVRQWKNLKQRDRRMIRKAGVVFADPYEALEAVKMERKPCTNRFPSKEKLQAEVLDVAQERNGTVRHCVKPKGRKTGGYSVEENVSQTNDKRTQWIQAVDENGRPLCLSCKGLVDTKNTNCLWDERFCSHKCKEHYQCRISGTRVRSQLFQDEKGVCQKCGCDAHKHYRSIKLLPIAERRSYLENTSFITLPVSLLNKIIVDPKEGMFWEADHVVAVVEGGGECDLENYRTLCVPCHRQVTAELRERLRTSRQKRRIAGVPDITSFFCS